MEVLEYAEKGTFVINNYEYYHRGNFHYKRLNGEEYAISRKEYSMARITWINMRRELGSGSDVLENVEEG